MPESLQVFFSSLLFVIALVFFYWALTIFRSARRFGPPRFLRGLAALLSVTVSYLLADMFNGPQKYWAIIANVVNIVASVATIVSLLLSARKPVANVEPTRSG